MRGSRYPRNIENSEFVIGKTETISAVVFGSFLGYYFIIITVIFIGGFAAVGYKRIVGESAAVESEFKLVGDVIFDFNIYFRKYTISEFS